MPATGAVFIPRRSRAGAFLLKAAQPRCSCRSRPARSACSFLSGDERAAFIPRRSRAGALLRKPFNHVALAGAGRRAAPALSFPATRRSRAGPNAAIMSTSPVSSFRVPSPASPAMEPGTQRRCCFLRNRHRARSNERHRVPGLHLAQPGMTNEVNVFARMAVERQAHARNLEHRMLAWREVLAGQAGRSSRNHESRRDAGRIGRELARRLAGNVALRRVTQTQNPPTDVIPGLREAQNPESISG